MSQKTDVLGDRLKSYEATSTGRKAFKGQPIIARLDGRAFHTFTKGLKRPYDERMSTAMINTMKVLVEKFQPLVGYTQSDEITLCWYLSPEGSGQYPFDGRFQKFDSLLASQATVTFNREVAERIPEKVGREPIFDCRTFTVPTIWEAEECFFWRQKDATKNAISMAAQSMFSHKTLQGLSGSEMQEKMFNEKGINFNDYPTFFKRGVFAKRVIKTVELSDEALRRIPEAHRPTEPVKRTVVETFDVWLNGRERLLFA